MSFHTVSRYDVTKGTEEKGCRRRKKHGEVTLSNKMDDICIAYGILMEMGQSVNIADWYKVHRSLFLTSQILTS